MTYIYLKHEEKDQREYGMLEVIDTATGAVLHKQDDADPWPTNGMVYMSRMALSGDGRWLFHFKIGPSSSYVETFDTEQDVVLPEGAPLPGCGPGTVLPSSERGRLYAICQQAHVLTLNDKGRPAEKRPPSVRIMRGNQLTKEMVTAFLSRDERTLTVIKWDGQFTKADAHSGRVMRQGALGRSARQMRPCRTAGRSLK